MKVKEPQYDFAGKTISLKRALGILKHYGAREISAADKQRDPALRAFCDIKPLAAEHRRWLRTNNGSRQRAPLS